MHLDVTSYNPSYFCPAYGAAFEAATGDARWAGVVSAGYAYLEYSCSEVAKAGSGLVPDWACVIQHAHAHKHARTHAHKTLSSFLVCVPRDFNILVVSLPSVFAPARVRYSLTDCTPGSSYVSFDKDDGADYYYDALRVRGNICCLRVANVEIRVPHSIVALCVIFRNNGAT